jgi:RHS repeat-associated protein
VRNATTHTTNSLTAFSGHRFHFNGKETDNEVYGEGNVYDYGFRIYNPRLCKFLSVDPLTKEYPWYTPYQFAGNKPIWAMDRDGLEEWYSNTGSSLPAHLFKESNAHVSDIKPVAFGPFSPEYAESEGLSSMPVLNLPEIVVTPSTSFVPELLTPRNNDYSPFIPTASDVYNAADIVGDFGDAMQYAAPLTGPLSPEVAVIGATLEIGSEAVKTIVDVSQQGLEQGMINGGIRAVGIVAGEGVGIGIKQLTKQGGEALGEGLKIPINAGIDVAADAATSKPDSTENKP